MEKLVNIVRSCPVINELSSRSGETSRPGASSWFEPRAGFTVCVPATRKLGTPLVTSWPSERVKEGGFHYKKSGDLERFNNVVIMLQNVAVRYP